MLVLDDDPASVVNLREGAVELGLEVKSAFTAAEAVDILSRLHPVAVVIGATLPEEDGSSAMSSAWELIKDKSLAVLLVWDGEGKVPDYGYTNAGQEELSVEMTHSKIARVLGCVGRPLDAVEVLTCLRKTEIWQQKDQSRTEEGA